jgi:anti-sigma regulatory factor (Ser/Thr protein kinase)
MVSDRVPFVLLAVSELASNTLRHSSGPGTLRLWSDEKSLFVQVSDTGSLPGAAVAATPSFPGKSAEGGYGLALAGEFSDEMHIHPGPAVIRLRLRLR